MSLHYQEPRGNCRALLAFMNYAIDKLATGVYTSDDYLYDACSLESLRYKVGVYQDQYANISVNVCEADRSLAGYTNPSWESYLSDCRIVTGPSGSTYQTNITEARVDIYNFYDNLAQDMLKFVNSCIQPDK